MQRILPAIAAFALVIAGVAGGLFFLASRDHGSLTPAASSPTPAPATAGTGPFGLPAGNVVVTYTQAADRIRIDQLAERLGAIDTTATRAAGQALVSKADRQGGPITATNGAVSLELPTTTDPRLASFVRQYLGRTP